VRLLQDFWQFSAGRGTRAAAGRLRLMVVTVALALGFATLVHVAHSHSEEGPGVAQLCAACTCLERAAPPPPALDLFAGPQPAVEPPLAVVAGFEVRATPRAFRSRAPPRLHA
jgi:hypothetical protein